MGGGTPRSTTKYKGSGGGGGAHGGSGGTKRKQGSDGGGGGDGDGDGDGGGSGGERRPAKRIKDTVVTVGKQTSGIKNKIARSELYGKLKHQKNLDKKKKRVARQKEEEVAIAAGETPALRQVPKTIENQRVRDATFVEAGDDEVAEEDAEDEFASYFSHASSPKIIITTSRKPSGEMFRFLENLFTVIPNAYYYARRAYHVQEIVKHASARGFTDLLVFNENRKFSQGAKINGMLHVHLPEGPTCLYKLSSLVLSKKIRNHGRATSHFPELILNNFSTRLGHRVGRMFASVFPQKPEFQGRRVVTFHNQRDFIFFRHHRYIFEMRKGRRLPHTGHLAVAEVPTEPSVQKQGKGAKKKKAPKAWGGKKKGGGDDDDDDDGSGSDDGDGSGSDDDNGSGSGSGSDSDEEDFSNDESDSEGGARRPKTKKKKHRGKGKTSGDGEGDGDGVDEDQSVRARLQELGPRFTLKLMSVQKGTFDSRHGEYEYVRNGETDGTKHNRRKFVL